MWRRRTRCECGSRLWLWGLLLLVACGDPALTAYHLRRARAASRAGEGAAARAWAWAVLQAQPAHSEALALVVSATIAAEGAVGVARWAERARAHPEDPQALYLWLHAATSFGERAGLRGRFKRHASAIDEALRRHPRFAPLVHLQVRARLSAGDPSGAFAALTSAFPHAPRDIELGTLLLHLALRASMEAPLRRWRRSLPQAQRKHLARVALLWALRISQEPRDERSPSRVQVSRLLRRWRHAAAIVEAASSACVSGLLWHRVAQVAWRRQQSLAGIESLAQAVSRCRHAEHRVLLPTRVRALAGLRKMVGAFRDAAALFEEEAALLLQAGRRAEATRALVNAAADRGNAGELALADVLCERAQRLADALGDDRLRKEVAVTRGTLCALRSDRGCATGAFETALRLAESIGEPKLIADVLSDYGRVLSDAGEYRRALQALLRGQRIERGLGKVSAGTLVNLGAAYRSLGEPMRALALYRRAAQRLSKNPVLRRFHAIALGNIGNVYRAIGDDAQALAYHQLALRKKRGVANERELGEAWYDVAISLRNVSRATEARAAARAARDHFKKAGAGLRAAEANLFLADLAARGETPRKALARLDEAVAELERLHARGELADALFLRAIRLGDLGERGAALVDLARSEALDQSAGTVPRWQTPYVRGLLGQRGDKLSAYAAFLEAARRLDAQRSGYGAAEFKTSFLAPRAFVYQSLARAALAHGAPAEALLGGGAVASAFAAAERGKARGLLDLLGQHEPTQVASSREAHADSAESESRLKRLRALATQLQKRIARIGAPSTARAERRLAALERRRDDVLASIDRLQAELEATGPLASSVRPGEPVALRAVQAALPPRTTLLQYAVGEKDTLLFVVTRTHAAAHVLPLGQRALEEAVRRYRDDVLLRPTLRRPKAAARMGHALHQQLLGAVDPHALVGQRLIIVPDGPLAYLPFEALVTAVEPAPRGGLAPGRPAYLVEDHAILYAPSASVFLALARRAAVTPRATTGLAAIGDPIFDTPVSRTPVSRQPETGAVPRPRNAGEHRARLPRLPGTADEVRAIAALVAKPHTLLLRADAREERVKEGALGGHRFVHIATHGLLDEGFQALALTQDPRSREDGFLERREIRNLRLDAELVTLSACETASGKLVSGEGVVGLTQAFFYAGAPRLVVSLWQVEDRATARLMTELYRRIGPPGAPDVAGALREAKRTLLADPQHAAPYFWAAFVTTGLP